MRFAGVDFPCTIIDAQERGELAIFAGAGVSFPSPSDLPDFKGLANELANGTAVLQEEQAVDRFLGALPRELNIYERTQQRLSLSESKPNTLHYDLLRIFLQAASVRVVTTNFDDHFATAAKEQFSGDCPEMFFAPALPVGSDFRGIVHIHGSVTKDPSRMVLTDKDFGRAYLTEGWARRFVQELFLKYTVLFVGYSHDDPVMHYLARGLPPTEFGKRRFALGLADARSQAVWENRGIQLIPYAKDDSHIQLRRACTGWANLVISTPLEKKERIEQIVAKPPQPAGEDTDLIERAFEDIILLRFFADSANLVDWLNWASGRDAFRRLFRTGLSPTEHDNVLSYWFAEKFATRHAGLALNVLRENGSNMSPVLWQRVAGKIWTEMRAGEPLSCLSKWVPLLITNHPQNGVDLLEYILSACRLPEDSTTAVLLFSHLLRPAIKIERSISGRTAAPDVSADLETRGSDYYLQQAWGRFNSDDLSKNVFQFLAIATAHLEEATLLFRAYGDEHEWWDPISLHLPQLDRPNISLSNNGLSVIVRVALDSLKWLIKNDGDRGPYVIELWSQARSITLRRLAVYGVALTDRWGADEKLAWLLRGGYTYVPGFSAEVSGVLESAYSNASKDHRQQIVNCAIDGPLQEMEERRRDHRIYVLLMELEGLLPGDAQTLEAISGLRQKYPEFIPTENKSSDSVGGFAQGYSPWRTHSLPFDAASLGASTPKAAFEMIQVWEGKQESDVDHDDAVRTLAQTVLANADWGFEFAAVLGDRTGYDSYLWKGLILGWNNIQADAAHWHRVLRLMAEHKEIVLSAVGETVELLNHGISQQSGGINAESLLSAIAIARQAWPALASRPWFRTEAEEWLTVAINDPAGILMQFELRALTQLWKGATNEWKELPPDWRDHFLQIIKGGSWTDAMAAIILASQFHLIFAMDPEWSTSSMPSLFDWRLNFLRAQMGWHGYLVWGRWSEESLGGFLPSYIATFPHVNTDLGDFRQQFCEHMAGIAVFSSIDPLDNGWLSEFIRSVGEESRINWANSIQTMLKQVPGEQKRAIWDKWIKKYWQQRILGLPYLPSGQEVAAMATWPMRLDGAFAEAVDLFLQSPPPSPTQYQNTFLFMELNESGFEGQYPDSLALFIRRLLETETGAAYFDPIVSMVERLIPVVTSRKVLIEVCEQLGSLGYLAAGALKHKIENYRVS